MRLARFTDQRCPYMSVHQKAPIGETFAAATGNAARLEPCPGSRFSLFDGRVEGRQVELAGAGGAAVAVRRCASGCLGPGVYSIVRFTLTAEGDRTRFIVDHDAIPAEWHEHIETGHPIFYQEPMARDFAGRSAA